MAENLINIEPEELKINIKKCPLCGNKLKRGFVKKEHNYFYQLVKCKNKKCFFNKKIILSAI